MSNGDEMLPVVLHASPSVHMRAVTLRPAAASSHLHLISLYILTSSLIKYLGILVVSGVPVGGHGPYGILQAHGRFSQRPGIKRPVVPSRMYDRDEVIWNEEECVVAGDVSRTSSRVYVRQGQ